MTRAEQAGTLASSSPSETHRFGVELGRLLEPGHIVGLVGELGAGKTALAAAVAEGMGVGDEIYVSSPTFTLVNEYPGRFPLIHMDFYRLDEPDDLLEIGLEDYYRGECACLVEWFDRFPESAPPEHMVVTLVVTGDITRRLELRAAGRAHLQLARAWVAGAENA